jgi:hypothetical protein
MSESKGPAKGASKHTAACDCKKCRGLRGASDGVPFEFGHELSTTHGAYSASSRLANDPRTREIADEIAAVAPVYEPADTVTFDLLAITLRRIQLANAAVERADANGSAAPVAKALRDDLRGWIRLARSLAGDLGLTPAARARMGLDVALTRRALSVFDLHGGEESS